MNPLRALIVEDSEDDALLLIRALKQAGYEPATERVQTAEAMRSALLEKPWDIVLCDYNMPQFSGLDALELIGELDIDLPFIIVSGTIGEETAVNTMKAGAHDYIMKDKLQRLIPAIERELREAAIRRERDRAEKMLVQNEARYRLLYEQAPLGYQSLDENGCVIDVNQAWLDMLGYRREEVIGRPFIDFLPPGNAARFTERFARFMALGEQYEETVLLKKDGVPVIVACHGKIGYDEQGRFRQTHCILHNVSEQRRMEKQLQESDERFRLAFENANIGMCLLDAKGTILKVNRQMSQTMGYRREEIEGRTLRDITHPDDLATSLSFLENADAGAYEASTFEKRYIHKDGHILWGQVTSSLVRDAQGRPLYFVSHVQDITDRKQHVEKLRKALGATVQAIASVVETKDPYTAGHQRRVADLTRGIATEMGLENERIEGLYMASVIHDIGKISVPAEILSKPTKLSDIEFRLIKIHPRAGYGILKEIEFPWPVATIILQHHERMNGSGYPEGLQGEELLPESRILQVADVVESMASHRPYRPSLGIEAALREIDGHRGELYDAAVVDACVRLFREKGFRWKD